MKLRASVATDTPALFRVWQSSVAATHDFVAREDLARIAELVRDRYLPNTTFTVACNDAGDVIGFMGMTGNVIDALFVDAGARGSGVGRLLLEEAQRLNPDGLRVDVNEQNEQAVRFYERMGFTVRGRSPVDQQGRPYPLLHFTWRAA